MTSAGDTQKACGEVAEQVGVMAVTVQRAPGPLLGSGQEEVGRCSWRMAVTGAEGTWATCREWGRRGGGVLGGRVLMSRLNLRG